MTENQLNKLKGRLLNVQTQINGASILLSKNEPALNSKIQEANKIIADVLIACESIKTLEIPPVQPKKKHKAYTHEVVREVIIARKEPATYNRLCRNYSEIRTRDNKVLERTCMVGMDMCYCSKKCAYATNNVCSLRG